MGLLADQLSFIGHSGLRKAILWWTCLPVLKPAEFGRNTQANLFSCSSSSTIGTQTFLLGSTSHVCSSPLPYHILVVALMLLLPLLPSFWFWEPKFPLLPAVTIAPKVTVTTLFIQQSHGIWDTVECFSISASKSLMSCFLPEELTGFKQLLPSFPLCGYERKLISSHIREDVLQGWMLRLSVKSSSYFHHAARVQHSALSGFVCSCFVPSTAPNQRLLE